MRIKTYRETFQQRAQQYQAAMEWLPEARQHEFQTMLRHAKIASHQRVCDVPAGGAYLQHFIALPITLIPIETVSFSPQQPCTLLVDHIDDLPFKTASVDRIISLAGLHHTPIDQRIRFYAECRRLLKPTGTLTIAEVITDSFVDHFLNEFVDQHNSLGYQGLFFTPDIERQRLLDSGFTRCHFVEENYNWDFPDEPSMLEYTRLLFGLDQIKSTAELRTALRHYLDSSSCSFAWSLGYFLVRP